MYYVYEIATSRIMQNKKGKNTWKSYGAARAFLTRMVRMGYNAGDYSIIDVKLFSFVDRSILEHVNDLFFSSHSMCCRSYCLCPRPCWPRHDDVFYCNILAFWLTISTYMLVYV